MDEQTRKALELARDALNDCDPMTIAGSEARALNAIDAALSATAAPVAQEEPCRFPGCQFTGCPTAGCYAAPSPAPASQPVSEPSARVFAALAALLKRDERNTCQHDSTHRGGVIWTICDDCGAQWADDEGGKPKWRDPPEWVEARAVLALRPVSVQTMTDSTAHIKTAMSKLEAAMNCHPNAVQSLIGEAWDELNEAHGIGQGGA